MMNPRKESKYFDGEITNFKFSKSNVFGAKSTLAAWLRLKWARLVRHIKLGDKCHNKNCSRHVGWLRPGQIMYCGMTCAAINGHFSVKPDQPVIKTIEAEMQKYKAFSKGFWIGLGIGVILLWVF